jgi:hypothetical protein
MEGLLEVLDSPGIESPSRPAGGSLMPMQAHSSKQLILFPMLWNRHTARIEVRLQTRLTPRADRRVEEVVGLERRVVRGSRIGIAG